MTHDVLKQRNVMKSILIMYDVIDMFCVSTSKPDEENG